jgi:phospholipid/cholesterol/gamma-HCH transport system ATP-binding protein
VSRLPRAPSEAVIEVRDLCNRFGNQSVHEHLDLDLYKGEILAVVGGSGSGKSVLLRSIVGLRQPTEGVVKVFGKTSRRCPSTSARWSSGVSVCCSRKVPCFLR